MKQRLTAAWSRFFFTPTSTLPLAVVRIAVGCLLLVEAYSWSGDLEAFFGERGISATPTSKSFGVFAFGASISLVFVAQTAFIIAGVCVILGFLTRLSCLVAFILFLSFMNRMPEIFNSGDLLLRLILALLILAPAGKALSLDRWLWRRNEPFLDSPMHEPWVLRLMQLELALGYLSSVQQKLGSASWRDGTAMYYGFAQENISRFPVPDFLLHSRLAMGATTWGLLLAEASLAFALWPRRTRMLAVTVGIGVHLLGHIFLELGIFSYVVWTLYLAFIPGEQYQRLLDRLFRRPTTFAAVTSFR